MSPMRVGSLDIGRRRRRPGIPQGRGRILLAALTVLVLLYVIGLASGDDDGDVTTEVQGAVASTSTFATTTTVAPPTKVTASAAATMLPAALSRTAAATDGAAVLVFGGRNAKGASVAQVLRYEPATGAFTTLAPLPEPLQGAAAVTIATRS